VEPVLLLSLLGPVVVRTVASLAEMASQRKREEQFDTVTQGVEEQLGDASIEDSAPNLTQLVVAVAATLGLTVDWGRVEQVTARELSRQRIDELLDESPLVAYMPPLPRGVKRTMNRLNFFLMAARSGGMFGGSPTLAAEHLLKWSILVERWPEVVRLAANDPDFLSRFEAAALQVASNSLMEWSDALRSLGLPTSWTDSDQLHAFLCLSPHLGAVAGRIMRFEPAENGQSEVSPS
jgi:hypothetical protein